MEFSGAKEIVTGECVERIISLPSLIKYFISILYNEFISEGFKVSSNSSRINIFFYLSELPFKEAKHREIIDFSPSDKSDNFLIFFSFKSPFSSTSNKVGCSFISTPFNSKNDLNL